MKSKAVLATREKGTVPFSELVVNTVSMEEAVQQEEAAA